MILKLVLPWFPILLAVGIGGRLLGRVRGYALGALCALFWLALIQAGEGAVVWAHPVSALTLLAGAGSIVAIGGWAGETTATTPNQRPEPDTHAARTTLSAIAGVVDQFDDWLDEHRADADPWPKFDEFLRSAMAQLCQATHVLPLRLVPGGTQLFPLREPEALADARPTFASSGLIGDVLATGRPFVAAAQGAVTVAGVQGPVVWCFPILQGSKRLAVVLVRRLGVAPDSHRELLRLTEALVTQFWCLLSEACDTRDARQDDPVSGLLTRESFLRTGANLLNESVRQGEPIAAVVIALERMRELNDVGHWELADELMRAVGAALRQKLRTDDRAGRFDGSRFVILLRRVDGELASLIVAQIMSRLIAICGDVNRWGTPVGVRCGFVCHRSGRIELRALISTALAQWRRAREADVAIMSGEPVIAEPASV